MGSVGCSQKWCSPNVYSVYSVCVKCVILCNTVLKKVVTAQLQLLLKILHCTAHKDSPLLKVTLILSTVGSKAPGLHWTKLQSAHIPMYIANCTLYTTRYSSSTANKSAWHQICSPCPCIIFHIAHCTLHIVHCTLHIAHRTLYIVHCTNHIVQSVQHQICIHAEMHFAGFNAILSFPYFPIRGKLIENMERI